MFRFFLLLFSMGFFTPASALTGAINEACKVISSELGFDGASINITCNGGKIYGALDRFGKNANGDENRVKVIFHTYSSIIMINGTWYNTAQSIAHKESGFLLGATCTLGLRGPHAGLKAGWYVSTAICTK